MALLPDRHPQRDFFVLDIADVVPKDDTASMAHPLFSLATKSDMRHLIYQSGENRLEIIPSGRGLPTIFDKDILIFCISQLMHRKNRGEKIGKCVRFSARELGSGLIKLDPQPDRCKFDHGHKVCRGFLIAGCDPPE